MKLYKNSTKLFKISLFLLGIGIIFSFGISTTAAANTSPIYVNGSSGNDNWNGLDSKYTSGINGPKATIKNATGTVNTNGTVHIASGTYKESNIQINTNMNIIGENQKDTIINGEQSGYSIFTLASGVNVTITNLKLTNGTSGNGGAIYSSGNLTVKNCIFTNNYASNAGGAIYSDGDFTVNNDTFTENQSGYGGGAIYNEGKSTVDNSIFTNNPGYYYGNILNLGSLDVNNSLFKDTETWFGGGICSFDNITVNNSVFINNTGIGGGGGIFIQGTAIILGSNFLNNNNANQGRGGASFNNGGTVSLNFCRIVGNEIYQIAGTTTDATLNWWGSNSNPTGNVEDGVIVGPWLVLNITADKTIINIGSKSTITADLLHDSNGVYHDPTNGHVSHGITVDFNSDTNGNVNPTSAILTNGIATTTFTGLNKDTSTIASILDQQTMTTTVTVNKIPTSITVNPIGGYNDKTVNLSATLIDTNGNPVKDANVRFSVNGTIVGTAITNNNGIATLQYIIAQTSGNYLILAEYFGNNTYTESNNINPLTVQPTPVTPVYDLYLQITSSNNHPKVGETFTLTYKLGNYGPDNATNITVKIPLPSGFNVSNITGNGNWKYNIANNTITWTLTNVPVGDPYLYITGKTTLAGFYVFSSSVSSETLKLNSENVNPIQTNPTTQSTPTNSITTVNADTTTIPMQHTGVPITGLILGILSVIGGSVMLRKK